MNSPYVSVIIAAFNCELFIERSIKSALDQKYSNLEVIVVDDKSTDNTRMVVDRLSVHDNRIRLICCEKNEGPSSARNVGIDAAKGKWVAVLDADDAFEIDRVGLLISLAEQHGFHIVADNFVFFDQKTQKHSKPAMCQEPDLEIIDLYSFVDHYNKSHIDADFGLLKPIFLKEFFSKNAIRYRNDIKHGEDWNIVYEALQAGALYALARNISAYLYTTRSSGFSKTKIDYYSIEKRMLEYSKIAKNEGDLYLSLLFRKRSEHICQLNLDYLGSMPPFDRPRLKIMLTAMRSSVGRRWLFSRLSTRWRPTKDSS